MKKFKFLACLCILVVVLVSIFVIGHNKNTKTFAETGDGEFTPITSIEDITDPEGKYILKNDIVLYEGTQAGVIVFSGELNGNGFHITVNNTSNNHVGALFNTINGGKVYNLKFSNKGNPIENFIATGAHAYSNGFLAYSIENAQIENIMFENCSMYILSARDFDILDSGFLSGRIVNSQLSQIRVKNSSMHFGYMFYGENGSTIESPITINANIGILSGTVSGCAIKNCVVENIKMNYAIGNNTSVKEYNIGGLVGVAENTKFFNNIVNLYEQTKTEITKTISINSDATIDANFGGLVGKVISGEKTQIINNFVMFDESSIAKPEKLETLIVGSMVGNLFYEPTITNVSGFLTNYNGSFFGKKAGLTIYSKFTIEDYDNIDIDDFSNGDYWNIVDEYNWNFHEDWMKTSNIKYPLLQVYENYSVVFDSDESKASLILPVLPQGDVIDAQISNKEIIETDTNAFNNITYGSKLYVRVVITDENNYSSYFSISALEINGKKVYDNEADSSEFGYDIQCSYEGEVDNKNAYTYEISNFNANMAGAFTVKLKPKTFKLNIKVYDLGTEETGSIVPGGFKIGQSETMQNYVLEMEYGKNYSINTALSNLDYSESAFWYIYDNTATDAFGDIMPFEPSQEDETSITNSHSFDFIFTENPQDCILLKPTTENVPEQEKVYFDIQNYKQITLEDGTQTSNYDLILVYTKRVKEVKIVLKYDNEEIINEKVAKILIDNKSDRIVWDEEEGVFYAKVTFDKARDITYSIKMSEMNAGMEFVGWYDDIAQLDAFEGDVFSSTFDISESTEEPLTIYCVFKYDVKNTGSDLLWLWITLGGVGLVAIVVVTIIIIKRRNSGGGKSYKKYYY